MARGRPKTKLTIGANDKVYCAQCGEEGYIYNGQFYHSRDCLNQALAEAQEQRDLVEEWELTNNL